MLDLYAGSGALKIEALSRGAATATLVDVDPAAARANVASFDLEGRANIATPSVSCAPGAVRPDPLRSAV